MALPTSTIVPSILNNKFRSNFKVCVESIFEQIAATYVTHKKEIEK